MRKERSVKIGVIDSGINPYHSHINQVSGGISISVGKDMYLEYDTDYRDRLGHGTAVAAAIHDEMPECELYAIRIFHESLNTYPTVLCAAMEWAIEQELDIINLSLGVMQESEELEELCSVARDKGIFVICSLDDSRGYIYPAQYKGALAVSSGDLSKGEFQYLTENRFISCGYPRELQGDVQKYNLFGHSFAAARFSGIIGNLIQKSTNSDYENVYQQLINYKNEHVRG